MSRYLEVSTIDFEAFLVFKLAILELKAMKPVVTH